MSKVSKEIKNNSNQFIRLHLKSLFVMSDVSKALYTYINRMKPLHPSMYAQQISGFLTNLFEADLTVIQRVKLKSCNSKF